MPIDEIFPKAFKQIKRDFGKSKTIPTISICDLNLAEKSSPLLSSLK